MQFSIEKIGNEQTPVVVIEGPHTHPETLVESARHSQWLRENPNYPGIRARVPDGYMDALLRQVAPALQQAYGLDMHAGLCSHVIDNAFCCFSMATWPPESMTAIQSLPHFDANSGRQLAMIHYLCGEPFQGTRFFRHRESGWENIGEVEAASYKRQARPLLQQVQPGYASHCDYWYEPIGEVGARFNRVAFYPASLLHSGVVPDGTRLPDNVSEGRLTITGFIDLQAPLAW